jgi:hypothetical protein
MITFKPLSPRDHRTLMCSLGGYLEGHCFVFAISVARGTGAELVCIEQEGAILHAGVRGASKEFRDLRGELSAEEFVRPFVSGSQFSIRGTTEKELMQYAESAQAPISEEMLVRARNHAESLWSEWKWKESHLRHMLAFAEELSALCKRYGVWMREGVYTCPPVVYPSDGELENFELEAVPNVGRQYMLRRKPFP